MTSQLDFYISLRDALEPETLDKYIVEINDSLMFINDKACFQPIRPKGKFIISITPDLDPKVLHNYLIKRGLEPYDGKGSVVIVFLTLNKQKLYDPTVKDIPCLIKNFLGKGKDAVTNKKNLFFNMKPEIRSKHMARSFSLTNARYNNKPLIIRPVKGFSGSGIKIVNSESQLVQAKSQRGDYIVSEYIKEPFLWNGLKAHIRMLLAVIEGGEWSLHERGMIRTAGTSYVFDDFENPSIHDTHVKSTSSNIYYPENSFLIENDIKLIRQQMLLVCQDIARILKPVKCWEDNKHGFEVFGLDFMLDMSYKPPRVILLECNEKVGYSTCSTNLADKPLYDKFADDYFEWIYKFAIEPLLIKEGY